MSMFAPTYKLLKNLISSDIASPTHFTHTENSQLQRETYIYFFLNRVKLLYIYIYKDGLIADR